MSNCELGGHQIPYLDHPLPCLNRDFEETAREKGKGSSQSFSGPHPTHTKSGGLKFDILTSKGKNMQSVHFLYTGSVHFQNQKRERSNQVLKYFNHCYLIIDLFLKKRGRNSFQPSSPSLSFENQG